MTKRFSCLALELCAAAHSGLILAAPADSEDLLKRVKAPPGWEVTLFAAPPAISYPTCLAAGPRGEVYVGIDENGSLDARSGRGRVVRCFDTDGDGHADKFVTFAQMDWAHPDVVGDF